ncbi:MAG TPA: ABC transporter ATP-binding protein [Spirochaetia bacterium]|nr:ABC transporter ATP-binding protein [Spirochaetia bacterium]
MSLELIGVVKSYPGFQIDLTLEVRGTEFLTLLGPSGCGKTTALRLIAGLIQPEGGQILLSGESLVQLPPHRREIGFVFQDYALFPHMSVFDNVAFGPRMRGWKSGAVKDRVESLLRLIRLENFKKTKVTHLSGGEQQRVALARALANHPRLLLLDEPLSALDAELRKSLRAEIRSIQRELGVSTLYVTHDQEEALALSDRIAVMRDGRILQTGDPREIYQQPKSPFVASFIGQSNLIEGHIREVQGRKVIVETLMGQLQGLAVSEDKLSVGRKVVFFFRPESCLLGRSSPNPSSSNLLRGRVKGCEYLGESRKLIVDMGGTSLSIKQGNGSTPRSGELIRFSVESDKCLVFPVEHPAEQD